MEIMSTIEQAKQVVELLKDGQAGDCSAIGNRYAAIETINALIAELATLQAKVASLHKAKGRYHNQIAICDLYDACGLFNVRPISDARS